MDFLLLFFLFNKSQHKAFPNPALIDELLSVSTSEASGSTPQLDHIVLRLSKDMIDDYPSSHPNDTAGICASHYRL